MLGTRPMVFLGLISYSLYLWHWPLLTFARYGYVDDLPLQGRQAILALSAVLATLSWRYVERPFRRPAATGKRMRLGVILVPLGAVRPARFPPRCSYHSENPRRTAGRSWR